MARAFFVGPNGATVERSGKRLTDYRSKQRARQRAVQAGLTSDSQRANLAKRCRTWSEAHALKKVAKFKSYREWVQQTLPSPNDKRHNVGGQAHTYAAYVVAYFNCYVNPDSGYHKIGADDEPAPHQNPDTSMYDYYVDVEAYFTPDEMEARYGTVA